MEIWRKFVAGLMLIIQLLLYPLHLLLRISARILLLVFTVAPVLIPLYLVTEGWTHAWHWVEEEIPRHSQAMIGLIALLSSLGLLANFLKRRPERPAAIRCGTPEPRCIYHPEERRLQEDGALTAPAPARTQSA